MTVHCADCNHEWTTDVALPMLLSKFIDLARGVARVGCPKCGARGPKVLCGPAVKP